jgi:hypothetical protein
VIQLRSFIWLLLLLGASIVELAAADDAPSVQVLPAQAVVRFSGTSTLHDFGGQLPAQSFSLILSNGTWFASADVLSGRMATANEKRDRKMHQMLGTNAFPKLHGTVAGAPVPGAAGTNATLTLTIRDQTNALAVRISAWIETSREIKFRADWEVSLDDFSLKPPSVLGVIRVGDRVKLEADVTATKPAFSSSPPTPPP